MNNVVLGHAVALYFGEEAKPNHDASILGISDIALYLQHDGRSSYIINIKIVREFAFITSNYTEKNLSYLKYATKLILSQ